MPARFIHTFHNDAIESPGPEVASSGLIETAITLELQDKALAQDRIEEKDCVFLAGLKPKRPLEKGSHRSPAANRLGLRLRPKRPFPWIESKIGFSLAESQKEVVALVLASKALVIAGGPGTSKTTTIRERDSQNPEGQRRRDALMRAERTRRQAHERNHRP